MTMKTHLMLLVPAALLLNACPRNDEELTLAEASQAVEESTLDSQAEALTGSVVEISTNFTIGRGVEAAAEELRAYVASQLPCAEIRVAQGKLDIEYGARPGQACSYQGQTYAGRHSVAIERNDGEVRVRHVWEGLRNQRFSVTGSADVIWSQADQSRHVVYDATWTRLSDGREGRGSGDVIQRALGGGLKEGVTIDGDRSWTGPRGAWTLDINQVEARWVDPLPQAGSYVLTNPQGKRLTLSFERVDADSIRVNVEGTRRDFHFDVSVAGEINEAD
jgi:hypothetical protein